MDGTRIDSGEDRIVSPVIMRIIAISETESVPKSDGYENAYLRQIDQNIETSKHRNIEFDSIRS